VQEKIESHRSTLLSLSGEIEKIRRKAEEKDPFKQTYGPAMKKKVLTMCGKYDELSKRLHETASVYDKLQKATGIVLDKKVEIQPNLDEKSEDSIDAIERRARAIVEHEKEQERQEKERQKREAEALLRTHHKRKKKRARATPRTDSSSSSSSSSTSSSSSSSSSQQSQQQTSTSSTTQTHSLSSSTSSSSTQQNINDKKATEAAEQHKRKRVEEEEEEKRKKVLEDAKLAKQKEEEEKRKKQQEEEDKKRKEKEQEKKREDEERKRREDAQRKLEEENRKKLVEEENRKKREDEDKRKKEDEEQKKLVEKKRKEEDEKKKKEEPKAVVPPAFAVPVTQANKILEKTLEVMKVAINTPQEFKEALDLFVKHINQIIQNPHNAGYRAIRLDDSQLKAKVFSVYGGLDTIKVIGFKEEKEGTLSIQANELCWWTLVKASETIKDVMKENDARIAEEVENFIFFVVVRWVFWLGLLCRLVRTFMGLMVVVADSSQ